MNGVKMFTRGIKSLPPEDTNGRHWLSIFKLKTLDKGALFLDKTMNE